MKLMINIEYGKWSLFEFHKLNWTQKKFVERSFNFEI